MVRPYKVFRPAPGMEIILGDAISVLRRLPSSCAPLILTDPPYGIDYKSRAGQTIVNDDGPYVWWLRDALRVAADDAALVLFCRWDVERAFVDALGWSGWRVKSQVVWDKVHHGMGDTRRTFAPQHELAVFAVKGGYRFPGGRPKTVIRVPRPPARGRTHPCEKPVMLYEQLMRGLSREGDLVLDPFMGSGASAVAAIGSGRRFVGIEIDAQHVTTARARVARAIKRGGNP